MCQASEMLARQRTQSDRHIGCALTTPAERAQLPDSQTSSSEDRLEQADHGGSADDVPTVVEDPARERNLSTSLGQSMLTITALLTDPWVGPAG